MKSIEPLIIKTHKAAVGLRNATDAQIKRTLLSLADALEKNGTVIIKANKKDVAKQDPNDPKVDRLILNEQRIKNIANAIRQISKLPNPSGKTIEKKTLKNGLELEKQAVPLGVVGVIYESRPNVTYDIVALCLRSMNACVLKGSKEAEETNKASVKLIHQVLKENNLPPECVTLLPSEREVVNELFTATRYVDVLIPRGSDGLIQYVRKNSLVVIFSISIWLLLCRTVRRSVILFGPIPTFPKGRPPTHRTYLPSSIHLPKLAFVQWWLPPPGEVGRGLGFCAAAKPIYRRRLGRPFKITQYHQHGPPLNSSFVFVL